MANPTYRKLDGVTLAWESNDALDKPGLIKHVERNGVGVLIAMSHVSRRQAANLLRRVKEIDYREQAERLANFG